MQKSLQQETNNAYEVPHCNTDPLAQLQRHNQSLKQFSKQERAATTLYRLF